MRRTAAAGGKRHGARAARVHNRLHDPSQKEKHLVLPPVHRNLVKTSRNASTQASFQRARRAFKRIFCCPHSKSCWKHPRRDRDRKGDRAFRQVLARFPRATSKKGSQRCAGRTPGAIGASQMRRGRRRRCRVCQARRWLRCASRCPEAPRQPCFAHLVSFFTRSSPSTRRPNLRIKAKDPSRWSPKRKTRIAQAACKGAEKQKTQDAKTAIPGSEMPSRDGQSPQH